MDIKWINKQNAHEMIGEKIIFIYGHGSLGKTVGKWLESNGYEKNFFCVDEEYLSPGLVSIKECVKMTNEGTAVCIYAIGENKSFGKIVEHNLKEMYVVFDPYEFWTFNDEEYTDHLVEINSARELLADNKSKETFDGYLKAKKMGSGLYSMNNATDSQKYFNELTKKIKTGAYIDCGAYTGDTIDLFRGFYMGFQEKIYAFEPDIDSFKELRKKYEKDENICLINKGVWDSAKTLQFHGGEGERSEISVSTGKTEINVVALDEIIQEKVSYVKIGMENAEKVLKGMEQIISNYMPIISMYTIYSFRDLYNLPLILKQYKNAKEHYRIYLRHHSMISSGLLFYYAIPVER